MPTNSSKVTGELAAAKGRILWVLIVLAFLYYVWRMISLRYIFQFICRFSPFPESIGLDEHIGRHLFLHHFTRLLSPWLRQNAGLRWQQAPGSLSGSLIIFSVCLGTGTVGGFIDQPVPFSLDTLCFQATMPSIGEELAYRGIALALLERAFGQSPMSCRWRFGWAALITSLLFWHGPSLSRVDTALTGAAFALVQQARCAGSLLWPMFCHSALNVASAAVTMIRYS